MTNLAYMTYSEWGQHGTAMPENNNLIQEWLGHGPVTVAVSNLAKYQSRENGADVDAVGRIAPEVRAADVVSFGQLIRQAGSNGRARRVLAVHPFGDSDLDSLRKLVAGLDAGSRVFVVVWSRHDRVVAWLEGLRALNLHTGTTHDVPDPLLVSAAELMVGEEYNSLAGGRGKDTVVQLLRAFAREGYPLDEQTWARAYFAAGGSFSHVESVVKFTKEMRDGVRHRTKPRYKDSIVEVLRDRLAADVN
ncbi:hypothetical protein [Pseudoclavibacter helvolus]|uniref:hypothetical protein n=1 Tax=Pseudoclavibacter helvolus TaxID=255205 RepID=UPI0024AD7064|nr:hypothetical protein [Pseudoclavibacter helvolus]